jgi:AraC-like DNA-binding protein
MFPHGNILLTLTGWRHFRTSVVPAPGLKPVGWKERLIRVLDCHSMLDPVAFAANRLFASNGIHRVSAMATDSGLSPRQFERRFLTQVGVPPKLYARIIRFNAALDHKLRLPSRAWTHIANDHDFYDQMHLVHDCRAFTGESPFAVPGAPRRRARVPYVICDWKPFETSVILPQMLDYS